MAKPKILKKIWLSKSRPIQILSYPWFFPSGILLFLVEIAILCWVKFYPYTHSAAWVATGLLIPIFIIFIGFAALFYLKLVTHKSEVYEDGIKELELLNKQLDNEEEVGTQGGETETQEGNVEGRASNGIQIV